ncbi:MAG: hypothetical protein H6661_05850 [Ardenticatenaceae bacterium]|nr:hypothetical protein [Ardenticatenaceae bacterium]
MWETIQAFELRARLVTPGCAARRRRAVVLAMTQVDLTATPEIRRELAATPLKQACRLAAE